MNDTKKFQKLTVGIFIILILAIMLGTTTVPSNVAYAEEKTSVYNVVIFLRFEDSPTFDQNTLENSEVFDIYSNDIEKVRSLKRFYYKMSDGQIEIENYFGFSDSSSTTYYVYNAEGASSKWNEKTQRTEKEKELISKALQGFENSYRDKSLPTSLFDGNNDGKIDSVSFIVLDNTPSSNDNWNTLIWPHSWDCQSIGVSDSLTFSDGSLQCGDYTFTFAYPLDGNSNFAVAAHEMGHVFGVSDYYSYKETYHPADVYDLMDKSTADIYSPSFMLVYTRDRYLKSYSGRIETLSAGRTITLTATTEATTSEDIVAIKIETDKAGVYIMAEYRINYSSSGYDNALPSSGVIVYKVDETVVDTDGSPLGNMNARKISPYTNHEVLVYNDTSLSSSAMLKAGQKRQGIRIALTTLLDINISVVELNGSQATIEVSGSYFNQETTPKTSVAIDQAEYLSDETSGHYGVDVSLTVLRKSLFEKVSLQLADKDGNVICEKIGYSKDIKSTQCSVLFGVWQDNNEAFSGGVIESKEPVYLYMSIYGTDGTKYDVYTKDSPRTINLGSYTWDEIYGTATYIKGTLTIDATKDAEGVIIGNVKDGQFCIDDLDVKIFTNSKSGEQEISLLSSGDFYREVIFPSTYSGAGTYTATINIYYKTVKLGSKTISFRILKSISTLKITPSVKDKVSVIGDEIYLYLEDFLESSISFDYEVTYQDNTKETFPLYIQKSKVYDSPLVVEKKIGDSTKTVKFYFYDTVKTLNVPSSFYYGTTLPVSLDAEFYSGKTQKVNVVYGDYKNKNAVGSTQNVSITVDLGYDYTKLPYKKEFSTTCQIETLDGVYSINEIGLDKETFSYGETVTNEILSYVTYTSYKSYFDGIDEISVLDDLTSVLVLPLDYSSLVGNMRESSGVLTIKIDNTTKSVNVNIVNDIKEIKSNLSTNERRSVGDYSSFEYQVYYANAYNEKISVSLSSGLIKIGGSPVKETMLNNIGVHQIEVFNPSKPQEKLYSGVFTVYEEYINVSGIYDGEKEVVITISYGDYPNLSGYTLKYTTSKGEKSFVLTENTYKLRNVDSILKEGVSKTTVEIPVLQKSAKFGETTITLSVENKINTDILTVGDDSIVDYDNSIVYLKKEMTYKDFIKIAKTSTRFTIYVEDIFRYVGGKDYYLYIKNSGGMTVAKFRVILLGDATGDGRLGEDDIYEYANAIIKGADDYIDKSIGGLDIDSFVKRILKNDLDPLTIAKIFVKDIGGRKEYEEYC